MMNCPLLSICTAFQRSYRSKALWRLNESNICIRLWICESKCVYPLMYLRTTQCCDVNYHRPRMPTRLQNRTPAPYTHRPCSLQTGVRPLPLVKTRVYSR